MKRKYKAGALVTNVAQLLDHEYFIVRFGIRNTPKTMHREALASWQLRICERFVRAGRVSVAERLTNGEYYASVQDWELLDMFDKELCEMCRDMNGLMIPCEGLCCGDVLAAWKKKPVR